MILSRSIHVAANGINSSVFLWPVSHCIHVAAAAAAKSLPSCPTLRDPIDGSPPGSRVPGILQARALEWAAIASCGTRGASSSAPLPAGTGGPVSWTSHTGRH